MSDAGPIAVVGAHLQGLSVHVDSVPFEGETVLGHGWSEPLDGGKATSQAIVARRLGSPVAFVTALGNDERGQRWQRIFAEEGLDCTSSRVVDGPTDLGLIMLPPSGVPAIISMLDTNRGLSVELVEAAAPTLDAASVVVCQLECSVDAVAEALRIGYAAGARTILNPAPVAAFSEGLLAHVEVLVPNEHEAAALVGESTQPYDACQALANRYPHLAIVLTAGSRGAFFAERGGAVEHVPAPQVDAVDTSGAGDAFVGALAVGFRDERELRDCVEFAVQVASVSVTRSGTIPSLPRLEEVTR